MFKPIPVNIEGVAAFKAVGKLTHADYQSFLPILERLIQEEGPLSLLLELENFHGWELEAAKDDYEFAKKHLKDFRRIAIVGDRRWEKWLAALARPFMEVEVRFFEPDQLSEAWDWVREGLEPQQPVSPEKAPQTESEAPEPWHRILVPVDFSPHAHRALLRAIRIAQQEGAELILLHVVEDFVYYDDFYDPVMPMPLEYEEALIEAAADRLAQWARNLVPFSPRIEVLPGSAAATILSYAEAQEVDLIVMGSHGRRGLARLLGSTTHAVLNRARCEVLSVPLN